MMRTPYLCLCSGLIFAPIVASHLRSYDSKEQKKGVLEEQRSTTSRRLVWDWFSSNVEDEINDNQEEHSGSNTQEITAYNWLAWLEQYETLPVPVFCPQVETVDDFQMDQFFSGAWYVHQQSESSNASPLVSASAGECSMATYTLPEERDGGVGYALFPSNEYDFDLNIQSFRGDVNTQRSAGTTSFCGNVMDADRGKFEVGACTAFPALFSSITMSDFWVVAYDENWGGGYALISMGGQPTEPSIATPGSCKSDALFILTRQRERDQRLISGVRAIAEFKGLDPSVLTIDVDQTVCGFEQVLDSCSDYPGTFELSEQWGGGFTDCSFITEGTGFMGPALRCADYGNLCPVSCGLCG